MAADVPVSDIVTPPCPACGDPGGYNHDAASGRCPDCAGCGVPVGYYLKQDVNEHAIIQEEASSLVVSDRPIEPQFVSKPQIYSKFVKPNRCVFTLSKLISPS